MGLMNKIFSLSTSLVGLEQQQKAKAAKSRPSLEQQHPNQQLASPPQEPVVAPNHKNTSHTSIPENENDDVLSQADDDDIITPLRQIKQPQPQRPQQQQVTPLTTNSLRSNNSSPKLSSTRSHSPTNVLSSTTTSPLLLASLDKELKKHEISSTSAAPVAITSNEKVNNTKPSPNVSRSSSVRKQQVSRASSVKQRSNSITSNPGSTTSLTPTTANLPRFVLLENGNHEHHLRSAKRQEKLSNMLKDLLGAKKLRDEAKSAVPDILQGAMQSSTSQLQQQQQEPSATVKPPTLFAGLVHHVKNNTSPYHKPGTTEVVSNGTPMSSNSNVAGSAGPDCRSFAEKYGRCQEVIGRGSFGVVRISHKKVDSSPTEKLFAVKEFKRRPNESEKKYNRRLTSEFCISSSLKHNNIIDTLDLLKDAKGDYCEVMEFCSGGDLYTLIIAAGKLEYAEADCFFKQLIRGVNYMHDMGVAHRDLKPENLLLTQNGVLKITDFGNSECFRMAWEKDIQYSDGICGSSPYIAPEEYDQDSFDPRCVDIWSCGVIYMAMRTGRQLWKLADPKQDEFFEEYLVKRKESTGYEPIESLKRARCRNVIYSILDPKPERRITGKQILNSEWGREIKVCEAGEGHLHE
ncbi:Serine/threonine-protein kinase HAL4/SAT4 [Candida viswanathii]|uniref:non-specific serine/threonine protein kinase n=1 Tax=Candida viswanathii TaxID=5486 RepID=A0A367Y0C6_9ASCO|nr:Serine/threonine-protein kinase HAL4/SAT4 [Candida viswanathii]